MTQLKVSIRDAFWCPPDIAELLLFYHSIETGVAAAKEQQQIEAMKRQHE